MDKQTQILPYVQHMFLEPIQYVQMHGVNFSMPYKTESGTVCSASTNER